MTGQWRRSTRCSTGACLIQRVTDDGTVQVADSKQDDGPILTFEAEAWRAFIAAVKASGS